MIEIMGFFKNLYKSALAATVGVLALTGCQPEESPLARAIMTSVSGLEFAAQNAEPQTIQVYADADWTVEAPEWVTVDKMEGSRSMEVTISVGDNMRGGAIDNPKKDTIVFKGYNLLAQAYVIVNQKGDKYRDVPPTALADVPAMKDEAVVILDNVTVAAVSTNGFIVTDGSANLFVLSKDNVAVGDKVNVKGSKGTINALPAISICDGVEVTGNAAVTYPATTDVTASIDTYSSKSITYVEISGVLNGNEIVVKEATRSGIVLDAPASFDLAALNGHKVTVKGYFAGSTVSVVNVIATEIVDLGVDEIIYFADNFDWVAELADAAGAGDSMGTNSDNGAKNAYTAVSGFADVLAAQGYEDLFPSSKTIYLQKNYLKFSKGSNVNGIRLPQVTYGGTTNVVLTFDWGVHVGSGGQDKTELMVEIEGNGVADVTTFTHTSGEWEWQTETVTISGIDDNSRIVIKPTTFVGAASSGYYRWYLDNVKIIQGEGEAPTPGPKTVFEDNFDWFADIAVAEGAGDSVGADDPGAKAPNVFTMNSAEQFLAAFADKGYKFLWGTVGSKEFTEGPDPEKGDSRVMYIQSNYLKFGKTSWNGAISLPALSAINGTADVTIEFDWCWQVTGAYKPDIMTLSVDASVGKFAESGGATSSELESAQSVVDGESHIEWQHAVVELNGATAETVLTIRPTYADPDVQNAARHQNRWYLDNIKIVTK